MSREERLKRLKLKIDEFVKNGGNIQDKNDNIPYYTELRSFVRNDLRHGVESTIASVYAECGYTYQDKKKPLTIERVKQEIDAYVAKGGTIFDPWDSLPYRNTISSFINLNKGWTVKSVYETCGYEYKDKPEPLTLERIKRAIDANIASGGSIYDPNDKLPYMNMIGHYIQNHKEEKLSVEKVYKLCGYDYDPKRVPVTIERIKKEIDKFVQAGGDIYDKSENIPYYQLIQWFIERHRRNGKRYSIEEVYDMCGYEYNSIYYNTYKLGSVLKQYKDDDGYVDTIKDSEFGRKIFDRIQDRAQALNIDVNDYLMCMFGVRVKDSFSSVDYPTLVGNGLKEHYNLYGINCMTLKHISKNNPTLYNRIRNLATYFPDGSVSMQDVLYYYGYDDTRKKVRPLDEDKTIESLNKLYPDKVVKGLSKYGSVYMQVVRLSAMNGTTVEKYLTSKGFNVERSQGNDRLAKAKIGVDGDLYKQICEVRKELIKNSKALNNPNGTIKEINEELEKIGSTVIELTHVDKKVLPKKTKR